MTTYRDLDGIAVFGDHEPNTLEQMRGVARHTARAALMADAHHGYVMPVGGVAAYAGQVSVLGVGVDIACGNAAIRTDRHVTDLGANADARHAALSALADEVQSTISFGMGRRNRTDDAPTDDPLFEDPAWRAVPGSKKEVGALKTKARQQLGTVGGGNHYVDVFADETGALWVGVLPAPAARARRAGRHDRGRPHAAPARRRHGRHRRVRPLQGLTGGRVAHGRSTRGRAAHARPRDTASHRPYR